MATATRFPKFRVANHNYEYLTAYSSNHYGFTHHCTLYRDGIEVAKATCHYLNRTWERYTYQSVIHNVIYKYFAELKEKAVNEWKAANNRTRISKAERAEITKKLDDTMQKLIAKIDERH